MTITEQLAAWAAPLTYDDIPERVVGFARSQVVSQLAAARAALAADLGRMVVDAFGRPLQGDPKATASVLSALTMCLDFDDTVYAGHVSHSTVGVSLAAARALRLDGRRLLTAVVAANECAARVTAAATLGPFRGQTAAHAHLAGSVAARLRAEGAPAARWVDAWGIAFAMPPWSLTRAFMGSDAKVLTAAVPVRTGLDACDAARAGLRGAPDILEHDEGFLARFSDVPLPDAAVAGLGTRWHTETVSLKVYPGCAYLDAALDCAVALHDDGLAVGQIEEVVVHAPIFTSGMDARSAPYVHGPATGVSALNFSVPYNMATALLTGDVTPSDFDAERVADPVRWDLARRVRVELDLELSKRALLATAPLGEALRQAGERAKPWLARSGGQELADELVRDAGPPSATFEAAEKAIGARVVVRLSDGRVREVGRDIPVGAAGPDTRANHAALMRRKLVSCGGSKEAAEALGRLEELGADDVEAALADVLG